MKVLAAAIVAISFLFLLPRGTQMSAATVTNQPLSVQAANEFCRSHPSGHERIWLHGWFIVSIQASGFVEVASSIRERRCRW